MIIYYCCPVNNSHFSGQPVYCQVLKLLDKEKILQRYLRSVSWGSSKALTVWMYLGMKSAMVG